MRADYVVCAGGVRYAVIRELQERTDEEAIAQVETVGNTLTEIMAAARRDGVTPHLAALRVARRRVAAGARLVLVDGDPNAGHHRHPLNRRRLAPRRTAAS